MSALQPPRIITTDPGAHELEEDDTSSSDHFSSASEGTPPRPARTPSPAAPSSPIPITRVERVDDAPAHGEVPGTNAYDLRTQDAVPDEIEIVPDGQRSRSSTLMLSGQQNSRPGTPLSPGGSPVPKTVVERVDDRKAFGEVEGTEAWELRRGDAEPDEVRRVGDAEGRGAGREEQDVSGEERQEWFRSMWEGKPNGELETGKPDEEEDEEQEQEEENDFDDFAEEGDDDFGDFDEADQTPMPAETQRQAQPPAPAPNPLAHLPPLDFSSPSSLKASSSPYLDMIFPPSPPATPPTEQDSTPPTAFLSPRSESLWHQLLSPPPMAPPNWTRSKIRRLFLVSLGVPVDLDEILPPSKVRRLVLKDVHLTGRIEDEGRESAETGRERGGGQLERLRGEEGGNESSTSVDSKTGTSKRRTGPPAGTRRRKASPPPPAQFDENTTAALAATTDAKLQGMSAAELTEHLRILRDAKQRGEKVLEFWAGRVGEALREKEALEGVIENLVGFVKGRRG
ncbi:hypothetical protein B0A48_03593 [Cryoendolithus antarcticus]|uniref:Uncharacterized protein n=1 Tax=Cryoendolithus antarcticus TaxID=1507870 RepID=A0A1V8TKG6_9PEZI|nr:hypothetical protein B0A48_03593 [Cryoendolithus antarcticus]